MDKIAELLQLIGITDTITEETDVKALADAFKEKQAELHKNNPAIMDEEKAKAKKEGEIVATKRFKKTLNKDFGLGLTDSEVNEISVEDLAAKVKDATKSEVGKDVEELQKKIIEITNAKTAEIDRLKAEKEEVEATWTNKYKDQLVTKTLLNQFNGKEYIGSKDKLFDYFKKSILSDGYTLEVDDDGNVTKIMKGGYEALKPDNSAKETLESLHERIMGDFVKKSNGADDNKRKQEEDKLPENVNPAVVQRLKEMQERNAAMV